MEILAVTYVSLIVSIVLSMRDNVGGDVLASLFITALMLTMSISHIHSLTYSTIAELTTIKSNLVEAGLATYTPKVVEMEFILLPVKAEQTLNFGDTK